MEKYMEIAFQEALKAYQKKEIPVGAVIVKDGKIIAKAHNDRQEKYNLLGHAEINAILKAEKKIKDWRLDGCDLYVTLEPCEMCNMLIKEARIDNVYYMLNQNDNIYEIKNKQINVREELREEYQKIIDEFFRNLRH